MTDPSSGAAISGHAGEPASHAPTAAGRRGADADAAIVEGYRRLPATPTARDDAAGYRSIAAESWPRE